ncbi:hypothetical protein F1D05_10380 [Kribbella qitaiheensis]|uniref:Competence protein CoiA nuclease-like domain-containing protein n=1 Tax=Kribbella qitaiheensis TaxID=1544730 RepID=A0A7G6WW63_9ACTN|nr:hypothetical protein [Kribbella qitaiheensis]QNE18228.1 hypothetical protein F1D05_10380 [Kribbella qitaiheensis]
MTGPAGEQIWTQIHRVPAETQHLACIERRHAMTAAVSPRGTRHFKHRPGASQACTSAGESIEHQELKARIARLARACGWEAHLERSGDGWRADVLTTSPAGDRTIVWEIQTSRLDEAAACKRTQLHVKAGHEIVWLLLAAQTWDITLPTLLLEPDQDQDYTVTGHLIGLDMDRPVQDVRPTDGDWHWTVSDLFQGLTPHWACEDWDLHSRAWVQWPTLLGFDVPGLLNLSMLPGGGLVPIGMRGRGARIRWLSKPGKLSSVARAILEGDLWCMGLVEPMRMVKGRRPAFSWAPVSDIGLATRLLAVSLGWDLDTVDESQRTRCDRCGIICREVWTIDGLGVVVPHCPVCDAAADRTYREMWNVPG